MPLAEKELKQVEIIMERVANRIFTAGRKSTRTAYQATERRLRAYPTLKANIKRYEADIQDISHEDMGKSADIVIFRSKTGKAPERDLEALRAEKIFTLTEKLNRDSKEVREIEIALEQIKQYEYYKIIPMIYFQNMKQEEIEKELHCERTTIWRNRKVLVSRISEVLYGADALNI